MKKALNVYSSDPVFIVSIIVLTFFSLVTLNSIAGYVFPTYFLYILLGLLVFIIFSQISFSILSAFSVHLYIASIALLILPLIIGQVTRGTIRWLQIGPLTLQPAEIIRPFLLIFMANYLASEELTMKRVIKGAVLGTIPLVLILIQPSLGVTALTALGFIGMSFSLKFNKKLLLIGPILGAISLPIFWFFMEPYQKIRIETLFDPNKDPAGAGYNSIQSLISAGSGGFFGRGLGEGVQTQLLFLPERHTDFIFASVAEELGFIGAIILMLTLFTLLFRVVKGLDFTKSLAERAFVSGVFLTLFAQSVVHIGMNMGMFPITGLPLPLVSSGGSSLLGTLIMLGVVIKIKER